MDGPALLAAAALVTSVISAVFGMAGGTRGSLLAGVSGPLVDVFFVRAELDRFRAW